MALDPITRQAWTELVDVYQHVIPQVVARLEDDAGVDSGVFSILGHLVRAEHEAATSSAPAHLRLGELHARMRVRYSQPGLSRAVQRMEADGLVARHNDSTDGRATVLVITRKGRAFHRRASAMYEDALAEYFGAWVDSATGAALHRALGPIAARMTERDTPSPV
ncbi:MAG: MarR family winged helix-turn-helix transcriptional regulator [Acidimicrobiia bacterium]